MKILASVLNTNTAFLGESARLAEQGGADTIHIDVMDGHYVNNFSFGPQTIKDLKTVTNIPIDVHLEVDNPEDVIDIFAKTGVSMITVQLDCCTHPLHVFSKIKSYGIKVGVAINITEDLKRLPYIAEYIDFILLMSVEPGFGGQKFNKKVYEKVRETKAICEKEGLSIPIGVDGGVTLESCKKLYKEGVSTFVIGTAIFGDGQIEKNIQEFKNQEV